jgi:hypothetical protein
MPYDQVLLDDIGLESRSHHHYLNVIFAAFIEAFYGFLPPSSATAGRRFPVPSTISS